MLRIRELHSSFDVLPLLSVSMGSNMLTLLILISLFLYKIIVVVVDVVIYFIILFLLLLFLLVNSSM